jgi:DNA repair protein SbcC/Rad50
MRIAQLDLKAFGHFTDRRIVFEGGADFHMAYGPNEAGKTTISRALKAALFGIPERTTDNHLHANPKLRVGVVLASSRGERLAAMRRKARKNSLVRYDPLTGEELGEVITDEQLTAWMGGLPEGLFTSMFGLDHDELVAGGKALSEGKGELGQSLFEAGAGLSSVRALRDRLQKEADDLFRPRALSSAIYKVLDRYSSARSEAKDAQTKPAEWESLSKAAEEAKTAYEAARAQQENLQTGARRLERLAAVLPDIAARSLALERLAILGEVTKLPASAPAERIAAVTRLRQAERDRDDVAEKVTRHEADLQAIALPQTLLQEGGSIESLYYALDDFRNARETAASAKGRMDQAGSRSGALLTAIGESLQGDLRSLIPSATFRARVQTLVTKGATLQTELAATVRLAATTKKELDDLNGEMAELGPHAVPASVVEALKAFDAEGNPESKAEDMTRQAANSKAALDREAAVLTDRTLEALVAMRSPLPAEIQRFRARRDDLEQSKQSLKTKIEGIENDVASLGGELEGLMRQGDVPTAEQLSEHRNQRDRLWQTIRRKVFPEASERLDEESLPTAAEYEWAVQAADTTADHRFTDAARVSRHADLLKRLAQMRNAIELERGRLDAADKDNGKLKLQWQAFLEKDGLPALGVAELNEWLAKRDVFLKSYHSYADITNQAKVAATRAAAVRASLSAALAEAGRPECGKNETLAHAIGRARALVEQANKAAASRKVLAKNKKNAETKLADAQSHIAECKKRLDEWRIGWRDSMTAIRLAGDAGREEATARLEQFENLEEALDQRDAASAELATAQATMTRVEREIARLSDATGYDRANRPADAVIETLYERLSEAKALAQRRATLEDLIKEAGKTGAQVDQSLRLAEQELARLKSAAGRQTLPELIDAEDRSAEYLKLKAEIAATEARLVEASALPLQELLAQAEGQDLALVKAALERVSGDLDACTSRVETLHGKQIESQTALGRVDGEAVAADAEQRAADAAATLSNLVADYASARLASTILSEAIETYQQRYQGPLLTRASELFATITGGRFAKVATDFAEDMTILVGVRPNGKRETVGNLSSGTRDQLFLALRLAAIESHVANQEPMPVVVDDIVINFDDASAGATFKVLAELSGRTQVLFFTHHEHLLERAAHAIGTAAFTAHKL